MTTPKIPENLGFGGAVLTRAVLRKLLLGLRKRSDTLQTGLTTVRGQTTRLRTQLAAAEERVDALEGLQLRLAGGADANTGIAVSGVKTGDTLLSVSQLDVALTEGTPNTRAWTVRDLTAEASIIAGDEMQLSSSNTTGSVLLVLWRGKDAD